MFTRSGKRGLLILCKYDLPKDFAFSPILGLFKSTLLIGCLIGKCCLAVKGCFHPLQRYIETKQCQPQGQKSLHLQTEKRSDTLNLLYKSIMHFSIHLLAFTASVIPYPLILVFLTDAGLWHTVANTQGLFLFPSFFSFAQFSINQWA